MKRFLLSISLFLGIPLVFLFILYVVCDPFRTIHPFDTNNTINTNREYQSTELLLRNKDRYQYNSFVFCSSRGNAINTYQWKTYLNGEARPYLFQAWAETLSGIFLKMNYLDTHGFHIDNALILIDIPSSFSKKQMPTESLSLKHFIFTHRSRVLYNLQHFANVIQNPKMWLQMCEDYWYPHVSYRMAADTITNDAYAANYLNYEIMPRQDSLCDYPESKRDEWINLVSQYTDADIVESEPLITEKLVMQLKLMKQILQRHNTQYRIIITPSYCYTNPYINSSDLSILQSIFGAEYVYNYTGKNSYTDDIYNFSDPNHFGRQVGYRIIQDIYEEK